MLTFGQAVTKYPIKSGPVEYRNSITEVDVAGVSNIIDLSSASACSTTYHKAASKPKVPFACRTGTLWVRCKTNIKSNIKVVAALWGPESGSGRIYETATEITLTATDQRDGATGQFLTQWYPLSVGSDDHGHFFVTNMGTAALAVIEVRQSSIDVSSINTLADIVTAILALPTDFEDITGTPAKTLADVVAALLSTLKTEFVTQKAAAWSAITTDTEFTPPTGTNGIVLAPKAAASGGVISGTVWGKPSGASESYRIAGAFSFLCSTATLDADGYTAAMQQIDITGLSDIKVIFTGGDLAYVPY